MHVQTPPPFQAQASRTTVVKMVPGPLNAFNPPTDLKEVVDSEIKEWHFHIYFHQRNVEEHDAALKLRDAVLSLRRDGAFVAVPLWRVNTEPIGPHPVGSYEVWCPTESFASLFSYFCQNRGQLSILVHPLTKEARKDHEVRNGWLGPSFPLDLDTLPERDDVVPSQYHTLKMGYSSETEGPTLEERLRAGARVEEILRGEKDAAKAPRRA